MYWTFVTCAIRRRARRLLLAFSALAVAAALATALFSIYSDVESRMRSEFSNYGANLVMTSPTNVPLAAVGQAREAGAIAAPYVSTTSKLSGHEVPVIGVDFIAARELTQFWHVEGSRTGCLAGVNLAQRFNLHLNSKAPLESLPCVVNGIVSTGGPEDNEIILPFELVAKFAGVTDSASFIEIRAPGERLESIRVSLQRAFPAVTVRIVQAVAETETGVVQKMRVVLFLLLGLILVITTMSVTSNFSELVMERSHEIGILKAIGAQERKIASLFFTESILLAVGSALSGYLAGVLLAGWIGRRVFAIPFSIHIQLPVLLLASTLTLTVALAATALAGSSIWRIQPARILRGE